MKTKLNFKQSIIAGLTAAGAATAINAVLFFIFHAAGIITDSIMIQPNQPMTVVPVIISSIIPTLIAALVFFLIEKYSKNGYKIFMIISIFLLLLSFYNPFMIPGVIMGYAVALNLMHLVVVASLLFFLRKAVNRNAGN